MTNGDKPFAVTISYRDVGKHLRIYEEYLENRKTPIYYLYNQVDERIKLGEVKWFSRWRKYCFYPYDETLFDSTCLLDLVWFMDDLNKQHNLNKKKRNKKS